MLIVGERINTSRKMMRKAVGDWDADFIKNDALKQVNAGAAMVDVNCGTFVSDELERMKWLVETVQEVVDVPLSIDSPNPEALKVGLKGHRNGRPMINSITAETERMEKVTPLVVEYDTLVIALCVGESGMPTSVDDRLKNASVLIEVLTSAGVPPENIYVDPVVAPISTDGGNGKMVIETIGRIKKDFERVQTICGLSNISYGLPLRKLINQNFLTMCIAAGLDAVIVDPLDGQMISNIYASEALSGKDEFCMSYITAAREEKLIL